MKDVLSVARQLDRAPRLDRSGRMKHMLIAAAGATVGIVLTIVGAAMLVLFMLGLE